MNESISTMYLQDERFDQKPEQGSAVIILRNGYVPPCDAPNGEGIRRGHPPRSWRGYHPDAHVVVINDMDARTALALLLGPDAVLVRTGDHISTPFGVRGEAITAATICALILAQH